MSKVVVMLSGGLDSIALMVMRLQDNDEVYPLFMDYGQFVAPRERAAALWAVAWARRHVHTGKLHGLETRHLNLKEVAYSSPLGKRNTNDNCIPGRNLYIGVAALAYAHEIRAKYVDFAFILAPTTGNIQDSTAAACVDLSRLDMYFAGKHRVQFRAPFAATDKKDVAQALYSSGFPLSSVWTCYTHKYKPCGRCTPCRALRRALKSVSLLK